MIRARFTSIVSDSSRSPRHPLLSKSPHKPDQADFVLSRFVQPHKLAIRSTRSYANGSVNSPFPKNLNESGRQVPSPGGSDGFEYLKWGSVAAAAGILGYVFMIVRPFRYWEFWLRFFRSCATGLILLSLRCRIRRRRGWPTIPCRRSPTPMRSSRESSKSSILPSDSPSALSRAMPFALKYFRFLSARFECVWFFVALLKFTSARFGSPGVS